MANAWKEEITIVNLRITKLHKSLAFLITLLLTASLPHAVGAQSAGWRAEYFNNVDLKGEPVLVRTDANINFNWGAGSPAPAVHIDSFSARWTRLLSLPAGNYRFALAVDDGARLWLNNNLVIDQWREQGLSTYTTDLYWPGGAMPIKLEYFERSGGALIQLTWTTSSTGTPEPALGDWHGEYYNDLNLNGQPVLVRDDANINFDWGDNSPAPGVVNADRFGVRWTRTLNLARGRYRFTATTDDGVRLWVNNRRVIDAWSVRPPTASSAEIDWPGGDATVRMEYFDNTAGAVARLTWSAVNAPAPTPTLVATPSGATGVVQAQALNVRSGPGVGYRPSTRLVYGQAVALIGRNRNATWLQVRLANGTTGWVSGAFLTSNVRLTTLPITG